MKSSASPAGGEIIQVQGGHIIRSTGRKDRHSKVYTAKGPRDRRVRLSAHTAIQFYDVQDRLGYDRPSKAVDWLINKAKSAIDKLAELPPWHPNAANTSTANADPNGDNSTEMAIQEQTDTLGYHNNFQFQRQLAAHENNNDSSSFIPQPLDSEAIADTMRSFFPTSSANASSMNYQSYPHHEMISTSTNPSEDLGLSLHSYHEPGLLHAGQSQEQNTQVAPTNDHHHHQTLFGAAGGYDNSMVAWSSEGNRGGGGGYMFHSQPLHQQQGGTAEALMGHHGSAAFTQRGTLQSSFIPSIRAWENFSVDKAQASIFSGRFSSDGLPVFWMPEQSRGQGGHGGVVSDHRPSSSSPSSHQ